MIHPIIRQIVDRQHVGESNRTVIRIVAGCFKGGVRAFLKVSKGERRSIMADVIAVHTENIELYNHVMRGT